MPRVPLKNVPLCGPDRNRDRKAKCRSQSYSTADRINYCPRRRNAMYPRRTPWLLETEPVKPARYPPQQQFPNLLVSWEGGIDFVVLRQISNQSHVGEPQLRTWSPGHGLEPPEFFEQFSLLALTISCRYSKNARFFCRTSLWCAKSGSGFTSMPSVRCNYGVAGM